MTANDSSSSAAAPPERLDVAALGLLAGLPAALATGRDLDLLAPLGFVVPEDRLPLIAAPPVDRRRLAAALAAANAAYGHPRAAELAAKLADPATRVVATGQQVGLFGGPLYGLVKALAAQRWAERLEASGQPAVALFWMATEAHDFREVASATFQTADGPRSFDLGADPAPLLPVGMRTFGAALDELFAALEVALPGERAAAWLATLKRWYRPQARFGEAFARLFTHLLGERAPLLLDSLLPELKSAEAPFHARLIERRAEVEAALAAAESRLAARGFTPQVAPQPGASPLFLVRDGERRRLEWRGADRFVLRGRNGEESVQILLSTLADNPAVVGPGVLARPAIQDAVLGTALQVMGPGEVAYLAQAAAIYPVIEVVAPRVALRPQVLVLDRRQREQLGELGLDLGDLLVDPARAERRLAERVGADFVAADGAALEAIVEGWRERALALDAQLERPFAKTREQIRHAIEAFRGKVAAAASRRDEVTARRFAALRDACLPGGGQQERTLAVAHFAARYGDAFATALLAQLDLDPRALSVVDPTAS